MKQMLGGRALATNAQNDDIIDDSRGLKGKGKGFKGDGKGYFKGDGKSYFKGDGKSHFKGEGKGLAAEGDVDGALVPSGAYMGEDAVGINERVVYQRQSRNAGIHTIEIYSPQFWFEQTDMEEYDARPERYGPSVIGKYTKGIGQIQARFNTDDEDPVSFCMTVVHRLLERIEEKGFNETGRYQPDGIALGIYHAIGRIDVGTESIVDRSKSMKSYVMDIFERYGDGEANIEGVDQYNACYGGQAAGLAVLSWVESDRWDGRYGIAVATDISEAHPFFIAFVGAATTATLFFPDAPLAHHSQRATCVLHRLDFCKPVGWHDMAPVTDGKYSVECYLDALDSCYKTLRKKLNNREIFNITDYNVFHTGGGYHIVKKAFERLLRNERPDCRGEERTELTEARLHPSCHILKRVGPCHTVSSFLNTASVAMSQMENALGKVILVFTYGSGCAASMYQLRIDDIAYFDPLEVWFLKRFYKNSIKVHPEQSIVHNVYVETWMKFDYKPFGRQQHGWDLNQLEDDVYYLGEVDKFGRRFYHRGGLKAKPLDKKYELPVDTSEGRPSRKHWGPMPDKKEKDEEKSEDDIRRKIEYEMTFDYDGDANNLVEIGEFNDTYKRDQKVKIFKQAERKNEGSANLEPDGSPHTYQIVGTWSRRTPQEMMRNSDGSWSFEFALGENRWEEFYVTQDGDSTKRIYPHEKKGLLTSVPVGPHSGGSDHYWCVDGRDRVDVPAEQIGMPGDVYRITFRWKSLKEITWSKMKGEVGDFAPSQYYIVGSWADFEPVEMKPDSAKRKGWHSTEVQMTSLGIQFLLLRNDDPAQIIAPVPPKREDKTCGKFAPILGPDPHGKAHWKVDGRLGEVYKISFFRDPEDSDPAGMRMTWTRVDDRPVKEPCPTYYLVGPFNEWGDSDMKKMSHQPGDPAVYTGEVKVEMMLPSEKAPDTKKAMMPFKIVQHKVPSRCVHPDREKCSQQTDHKVLLDDEGKNFAWHIGAHPADKAKSGDVFSVRLEAAADGSMKVSWTK